MPTHTGGLDTGTIYLNAPKVRRRYDNISDMTLWRWLHDPELGFPKPFRINGRRFWKEPELNAWERTRVPDGGAFGSTSKDQQGAVSQLPSDPGTDPGQQERAA